MKSIFRLNVILFLAIFLCTSSMADTVTFGDSAEYWPGRGNGTADDNKDVIGIPDFTGGSVTVNNGYLNTITFNRKEETSSYWWVLSPGDLFLDTNNDSVWDYFVDLTTWTSAGKYNQDAGLGNYNLYAISLALNAGSGYILSGADNTGGWSGGYDIRGGHPVAVSDDVSNENPAGIVNFSGWGDGSITSYSFVFGNGLLLGKEFAFSWMPNCANDVIYETMQNPVPEPASMLLLGTGLMGLAGVGRKKLFKK